MGPIVPTPHFEQDGRQNPKLPRMQILGMSVNVFSSVSQAAGVVADLCGSDGAARTVLTCNVDHVILNRKNADFRACYDGASVITADGAPIVWHGRLLRRPVGPRVTGADLLPALGRVCAERDLRLAVTGGAPNVSDEAVRRLTLQNPQLDAVSVLAPEYGFVIGASPDKEFLTRLQAVRADIVVVCLGSPKQELWMRHHQAALARCVLLGAGAAVDFQAGTKKRAPSFVQHIGAEWLYRLANDFPRLWRRYLMRDSVFPVIAAADLWKVRGPRRLRQNSKAGQ